MKTEVWAHRGASGYAPENTIEAFRMAAQLNADGVELDVQLTKDGELVVIHDERVDRVSDRVGYVKDYTLEELRPTGMKINIECKTGIFFYPGLEEKMVKLVEDMKMTDRIWCSSFNHESVLKVKQLCPAMKTGFLIADVIVNVADYSKRCGVDALHPALYHIIITNFPDNARNVVDSL